MPNADASPTQRTPRITSIDAVRGLAIAVMVLDHTRHFFSVAPFRPTDLEQAGAALFLTRWVSHFAAPAFFLLAGLSIHFLQRRHPGSPESTFLITRGLLLILLEATLITFSWRFNVSMEFFLLQVIWALGASMLCMALLIHLPRVATACLAASCLLLPESLHVFGLEEAARSAPLFYYSVQPGKWEVTGVTLFVLYPMLPWLGVMALGWVLTPWLFGGKRSGRGGSDNAPYIVPGPSLRCGPSRCMNPSQPL